MLIYPPVKTPKKHVQKNQKNTVYVQTPQSSGWFTKVTEQKLNCAKGLCLCRATTYIRKQDDDYSWNDLPTWGLAGQKLVNETKNSPVHEMLRENGRIDLEAGIKKGCLHGPKDVK